MDTLKVERERGITVRAQSASYVPPLSSSPSILTPHCRMFYTHPNGQKYILNLLDTPGHADFSSELLRSLLPSQGALLLVDAAQVRSFLSPNQSQTNPAIRRASKPRLSASSKKRASVASKSLALVRPSSTRLLPN